eukprot:3575028-Heterocapsa_arctica.AAC.1
MAGLRGARPQYQMQARPPQLRPKGQPHESCTCSRRVVHRHGLLNPVASKERAACRRPRLPAPRGSA